MMRDELLARRLGTDPGYDANDMRSILELVLPSLLATERVRCATPGHD